MGFSFSDLMFVSILRRRFKRELESSGAIIVLPQLYFFFKAFC
jgi:hypothetical protein